MFNISIAQISIWIWSKCALQFWRKSNQHCPNQYLQGCIYCKSRQPAKFASFPARFHRLLSLLHESKYVEQLDPQPSTFHKTPATQKRCICKVNAIYYSLDWITWISLSALWLLRYYSTLYSLIMSPAFEFAFRDFLNTHPLQSLGSNTSQNIHVWYLILLKTGSDFLLALPLWYMSH